MQFFLRKLECFFALVILGCVYLHYKDERKETMFERSVEQRITLEKEKSDEIERTENNINNELFKAYY